MDFVLVGYDGAAGAFVETALQRGWRLRAFVAAPCDEPAPAYADVPRLDAPTDIASLDGIDFVVLSGSLHGRADRLKSVLAMEPFDLVLSVPLAPKPDCYYELALARSEARFRILPLSLEMEHPALERIRAYLADPNRGDIRWIEWTHPLPTDVEGPLRFLDGWIWLRAIIGEVESVSATSASGDAEPGAEVVVSARSQRGLLASVRWRSGPAPSHRLRIETETGEIDCTLPDGFAGPALLRWTDGTDTREEPLAPMPPGECWIARWEALLAGSEDDAWTAAFRQIELAEAVDRSLDRHRAVDLAFEEISEETSFKSIMTMFGCGLIWAAIVVGILAAAGVPYVGYVLLPVLVWFLLLQGFGLVYRGRSTEPRDKPA